MSQLDGQFEELTVRLEQALAKTKQLRERLGPRGLEVVMIGGAGHYVNEKVKAEIERLRTTLEQRTTERDQLAIRIALLERKS